MRVKVKKINAEPVPSDHMRERLESFVAKDPREFARKKLKAGLEASRLLKENVYSEGEIAETSLIFIATVASTSPSAVSEMDSLSEQILSLEDPQQIPENQEKIIACLSQLEQLRNENTLIYGYYNTEDLDKNLGLGLKSKDDELDVAYYKKKFLSTDASIYHEELYTKQAGAVEFGITYDNKFFLVPKQEAVSALSINQQIMAYGTLLKAVGCIQIANKSDRVTVAPASGVVYERVTEIKYISAYNAFFSVQPDNIAVSLFVLQQLGLDLSATKVIIPNEHAQLISKDYPDCRIAIHGEIKDASYYLDQFLFPGAKLIAETTQLTLLDKMTELFCHIDDVILSKRNKKIIKKVDGEKEVLKLNILKFFLQDPLAKKQEKKDISKITSKEDLIQTVLAMQTEAHSHTHEDATSAEFTNVDNEELANSLNEYRCAINESIRLLKEDNIDLAFLIQEIHYLLAYKLQKGGLTQQEKLGLEEWCEPSASIPGRVLEKENISSFISFYDHDPMKTCFALLKNYPKNWGIFFFLWNRHHRRPVNELLLAHQQNKLPDNLTVVNIINLLISFGLVLPFQPNSTLMKRLLFCAKLYGEEDAVIRLINNDFTPGLLPVNEVIYPEDNTLTAILASLNNSLDSQYDRQLEEQESRSRSASVSNKRTASPVFFVGSSTSSLIDVATNEQDAVHGKEPLYTQTSPSVSL